MEDLLKLYWKNIKNFIKEDIIENFNFLNKD
jgi:hypothetical protein